MANEINEGFVTVGDGVRIAYRDHGGAGRGMVLLHGGGANLESMDQFAHRLGVGRHVVAMDVRSCGRSGDPERFRLVDAAEDVACVASELRLGDVDVVGHSLGGFLAGFYASTHDRVRAVSIDGFGPGMVTMGTETERFEFRGFQQAMKAAFFEMTAPPETGNRDWVQAQVEMLTELYPRIGYTAPNGRAMAERNFIEIGDGLFRRHPSRRLFADAFTDDGEQDVLRMYRGVRGPMLIIRCTDSGAPAVLDLELDGLQAANPLVELARLPLTHMAPAWDAIDTVVIEIERFLAKPIQP